MYRTELIQHYINTRNYQSYLELGVYDSSTYNRIICAHKDSVDCRFPATYNMTTDQFFANPNRRTYDIIFIDADHTDKQARKDIQNSLKILNPNGLVLLHDCNPPSEFHQIDENGYHQSVWKSFARSLVTLPYLCFCIPDDEGLGVIDTKYSANPSQFIIPDIDYNNLTYRDLESNRDKILNFKSNLSEAYNGLAC